MLSSRTAPCRASRSITAEVGRQPWTVYGYLSTADSLAPVTAGEVATSLLVFMVVYAIVFTAGAVYMIRIATRGFGDERPSPTGDRRRAPGTPLGSVDDPAELTGDIAAAE